MNAKETLKKLYEAIGGTIENEPTVEAVEKQEEAPEAAAEAVVEEAPETTPEAAEEAVEATEPVEAQDEEKEEAKEEAAPEAEKVEEAPESNARVEELERQLSDLREILKNAFAQEEAEPVKEAAPAAPEVKEEPKGLTHSPEKTVEKRLPKQQQNGGSIQSTVYKYMNNK